ncbi:hypothetical protein ACVDG3_22345 [Meridianimarinicoccus sp. RP-17]|nr:hypothetical protein [Phycocomes zhengii]
MSERDQYIEKAKAKVDEAEANSRIAYQKQRDEAETRLKGIRAASDDA